MENLLLTESWAAAKKSFILVWRCHQLLSGFLANDHLPRLSCQSHMSLMSDNATIRGCAQISWHLPYSWGKAVDEGCATSHRPKWGPLPPNEVVRAVQHVKNWKGRKVGKDGVGYLLLMEPRAVAKESFKLVWRCHQLLSGFLVTDFLPRVSCQSHLSVNDKSDNEMIAFKHKIKII